MGTVRKKASNAKKSHLKRIPDFAIIDLNRTQFLPQDPGVQELEKDQDQDQELTLRRRAEATRKKDGGGLDKQDEEVRERESGGGTPGDEQDDEEDEQELLPKVIDHLGSQESQETIG